MIMQKYYLWLILIMRAANPRIHKVIEQYGDAERAYAALTNGESSVLKPAELANVKSVKLERAERIIEHCEKRGYQIITIDDELYPERLRNIFNPPVVLFVYGDISGLDDSLCITGVGARKITPYTEKLCARVCVDLARLGTVLVSGMAYGTDSAVHNAAVECHGRTIGVLACGLDVEYPKGTYPLREKIAMSGGACISELLPQSSSFPEYFHARNRILSGLSQGTIIFQAGIKSGSLITANFAVQQSRDLFCVPPADVFSPDYAGVVRYLRDGAIPLFNHFDVINQYMGFFELEKIKLEKYSTVGKSYAVISERSPSNVSTSRRRRAKLKRIAITPDYSQLPEMQRVLTELIADEPLNIDQIESTGKISGVDIYELLLDMEIAGIIEAIAGGRYQLKLVYTDSDEYENEEPSQPTKAEYIIDDLPSEQQTVIRLLSERAMNIDEIERVGKINGDDINELLLDMELAGIIEAMPGANYRLL